MRILALEPYYGGSHKAFLDGWISSSRHQWTLLTLPPHKWKWRMRHSAATFARQVTELVTAGEQFDMVFCTDMLPLAEFKGLVDARVANLPSVMYFHENQLTYPVQVEKERDLHFGITNFISMQAADQVWFNSSFHRDSFFKELKITLKRMPEDKMLGEIAKTQAKSLIFPQAITENKTKRSKYLPPVHIGAVARWEFDKNPELFFSVLQKLKSKNIEFKLSFIGEQFTNSPKVFEEAKSIFKDEIVYFGYIESFAQYQKALIEIDILISTADHEFFGISVMEAIDAGVYPLLPNRLSYPELLKLQDNQENSKFFYDGSEKDLEKKLISIINQFNNGTVSYDLQNIANQYYWSNIGVMLDDSLEKLHKN